MRTALFLLSLCTVSCFNPSYDDGGFVCVPGGSCPQGYSCLQGHCWNDNGPGPALVVLDAGVPDATPDAGMDSTSPPEVAPVLRQLGETCDPRNAGTALRSDNCAAGLTCIDGNSQSLCFKRCVADAECGQASCEERSPEPNALPVRVCGLAPTTCSPTNVGSCANQRICYISGALTICEISSGDNIRMACTYSRECFPGYTCATGVGAGYCRQACSATGLCPTGTTCQLVTDTMGYCY